jgi:hypothetical protein
MSDSRPIRPQAIDVIPADQVSSLIAAADRDFVVLERQAQEAEASATSAEADAASAGIDPRATAWTMVRLQRFLESLRDEATRDAAATLEVARRRAQVIRSEAGVAPASPFAPAPAATTATDLPITPVVPMPMPEPAQTSAPIQPVVPMATGIVDAPALVVDPVPPRAPFVSTAPDAPRPPAASANRSTPGSVDAPFGLVVGTAVATAVAPTSTEVERELFAPAVPAVPVIPVPQPPAPADVTTAMVVPPAPAVPHEMPAPVVIPDTSAAATVPAVKAKRGLLRRLPVSAILEVIAVLLILVFILLRLS